MREDTITTFSLLRDPLALAQVVLLRLGRFYEERTARSPYMPNGWVAAAGCSYEMWLARSEDDCASLECDLSLRPAAANIVCMFLF